MHKIISGGQTGVDRAALDAAVDLGFEIGGWVPQNRWAEDGRISDDYPNLRETDGEDPKLRTELNVRDSDATLILSRGELRGGSKLTLEMAQKHGKPILHIDFEQFDLPFAVEKARSWLTKINYQTLNVAGPRASEDQQIYHKAKIFLTKLFA